MAVQLRLGRRRSSVSSLAEVAARIRQVRRGRRALEQRRRDHHGEQRENDGGQRESRFHSCDSCSVAAPASTQSAIPLACDNPPPSNINANCRSLSDTGTISQSSLRPERHILWLQPPTPNPALSVGGLRAVGPGPWAGTKQCNVLGRASADNPISRTNWRTQMVSDRTRVLEV